AASHFSLAHLVLSSFASTANRHSRVAYTRQPVPKNLYGAAGPQAWGRSPPISSCEARLSHPSAHSTSFAAILQHGFGVPPQSAVIERTLALARRVRLRSRQCVAELSTRPLAARDGTRCRRGTNPGRACYCR